MNDYFMFRASSFQSQCWEYVSRGVERWMTAHREAAASLLVTEGMWDQKVSTEIVVSIYRNRNAHSFSKSCGEQTLFHTSDL